MKTEIFSFLHQQRDNSCVGGGGGLIVLFLTKYDRNIYINNIQCIKINYKNSILVS